MHYRGTKIDWLSRGILANVYHENGETNTRTLTRIIGENNRKINYRYGKLEDVGLIETEQPSMDGSGQIPPKQVELTEAGEDFIKSAKIDIDEEPVEDRIEELRNRVDRLEDSLLHAYDRIEDLEGDEE